MNNPEPTAILDQLENMRIFPDSQIPPHRFLFAWDGTPCFARGELVAVTGKAKSGKTYFNSILMAVAQAGKNGRGNEQATIGIQRMQSEPYRVLWIDTEQSQDSTCEILRDRIQYMTGNTLNNDSSFTYNLRAAKWQDRRMLIVSAILTTKPDIVIIDGIRDVVGDINNYTEAQEIIERMLALASSTQAAIVCVLHQNKALEDKTLRGALGTELQNKAFETYECTKDPDSRIFTIRQTATRKYDLAGKKQFTLSADGIPTTCGYFETDNETKPETVFRKVLSEQTELRASVLKTQVKSTFHITSDSLYGTLLSEALRKGILIRRAVSDREVYYRLNKHQKQTQLDFGKEAAMET